MANKRISELTSITGANLADADLLVVVDVSDPTMAASGTNKKVTLDEFAQDSAFSSRYVSKSDEKYRWVSAPSMGATAGSPSLSAVSGGGTNLNAIAWLMDSSSNECISLSELLPDYWATYHVDLYWGNTSASSGDVGLNVLAKTAGSGEVPDGTSLVANTTSVVAAPSTQGEIKVSRLATSLTNTAGKPVWFRICRDAVAAGDTLANDAAYYALLFTRAS